ncbi:hypothetical protein DRE_07705 [Drechslerella stenobrocha 248]|uniref:Uncharacterized protein n=1 Tax=Drechslerella stenobrocha 248 TaxID=1043628 RepID=W7HK59_9PEZI|nr:hypothetical protein DRE_07705 [Drechslerella stenobrocha 248]
MWGSTPVSAGASAPDGIKAIPPPAAAAVAGLGLVRGFEGLNVKSDVRIVTTVGDDEDEDDDLFQLPISPRGTNQF